MVTLSAFLKQASQQTALLVSTRASVANTQVHLRLVFRLFVRSISCFVAGFALLIWLFAGLPTRIPFDEKAAEQGSAEARSQLEMYYSTDDSAGSEHEAESGWNIDSFRFNEQLGWFLCRGDS